MDSKINKLKIQSLNEMVNKSNGMVFIKNLNAYGYIDLVESDLC